MSTAFRTDVHQHLLPPAYRKLMDRQELTAGGWPTPAWDAQSALAMMDRRSIATGILSISSPGTHFGDDTESRAITRTVNESSAELARDHPDRFGFFASVPLPDVDGALAETAYDARTPSGFEWEVGWNPVVVDEATWEPGTHQGISIWGHTPVGRTIVDKLAQFRLGARSLVSSEDAVPALSGAGIADG